MNHSHAYNSATLYHPPRFFFFFLGLRQDDNQRQHSNGQYYCLVFKGPKFDFWFGPTSPGKPSRSSPQELQANIRITPYSRPRPLPSISIQIHHSQTALSSALEDVNSAAENSYLISPIIINRTEQWGDVVQLTGMCGETNWLYSGPQIRFRLESLEENITNPKLEQLVYGLNS